MGHFSPPCNAEPIQTNSCTHANRRYEHIKRGPLDADVLCVYTRCMKRRGRPPKAPPDKREDRLDLRVSAAEKLAFKLAAEKSQQDLSVWIRVQLHRAAGEGLANTEALEPDPKGALDGSHG